MADPAAGVAVALVTCNGSRFLPAQLESIHRQTVRPGLVAWVDDASTDGTREIVRNAFEGSGIPLIEVPAPERSRVLFTRIARNFEAAIDACVDFEFIALCDQDDVWQPHRIEAQRARLETGALMTAADGHLVDAQGMPTRATLRDRFPVPDDWPALSAEQRLDAVLRRPVATGAASMITRSLREVAFPIPAGWLHDRWLSLVAAARGGLDIDTRQLISYRVYDHQAVGMDGANVRHLERLRGFAGMPLRSVRKVVDLRSRLRAVALEELAPQLAVPRIVRTYLI